MSLTEAVTVPDVADVDRPTVGRIVNGVVTTIVTIVVAVVGTLTLVVAIAAHFAANNEYVVFGHPVMTVLSGSMSPTIRTGDLIIDDQLNADQAAHLHAGQIITFRRDTRTLTHRIVAVGAAADGSTQYTTKGDANNVADSTPVPASSVLGVFHSKISRGGYILDALHRPLVLWLLLASPILWFISEPLRHWARELDEAEHQGPADPAGEAEADEQ